MGKQHLCERGACGGRAAFKCQYVTNGNFGKGSWVTYYLCVGHAEIDARTTQRAVRMIPESWHIEALLAAEARDHVIAAEQMGWAMP